MADIVHSTHVSYEGHELIICQKVERADYYKHDICCACGLIVFIDRSPYYRCKTCDCKIHKFCAKIPLEMVHDLHPEPEHILTLQSKLNANCYHCKLYARKCASLRSWIPRSRYEDDEETINYHCEDHVVLEYSAATYPQVPQEMKCGVCAKGLDLKFGFYRCRSSCGHYSHVRCETFMIEPFMSILNSSVSSNKSHLYKDLIHLPMDDEFSSLVRRFKEELVARDDREIIWPNVIDHNHKVVHHDHVSSSNSIGVCNGCIEPISSSEPFYSCTSTDCNFLLHKECTKTPRQIEFVADVSLLFDGPNLYEKEFFSIFRCVVCHRPCNGFRYIRYSGENRFHEMRRPPLLFGPIGRLQASKNYSLLDVKCAFLPKHIVHNAHPSHVLVLSRRRYGPCSCCLRDDDPVEFMYRCNTCSYNLHPKCAIYPSTVRHKYDQHPLKLTYGTNTRQSSDESYCEICELELNQRGWFYHCFECSQFFHVTCIPAVDRFSNMKFGGTIKLDCHAHPLTFDRLVLDRTCAYCSEIIDYNKEGVAFQCKECRMYKIHWKCARRVYINQPHDESGILLEPTKLLWKSEA
ncbi:hypothetical protein ACH5RR_002870 [Cinchona calisaya]|uniref:DC1 domain-containing protein n=1 Tax=Cinchona calisaya TaxID=153742 RepID=A0ABD3ATS8_9GENT